METTREQILRLVRGHREVTVAQLAESLGLTRQAVQRQLDGLRADGLVDARLERHGVGRPATLFFATDRSEDRTYLQLLSRLFRYLEKTETDNEAGRHTLETVFAGIAVELAADHEAEVRGATLDERVAEVSRALEREGIVDGWTKDGSVYQLHNGECPYLRLAEMSDAPCRSDRQSIELLVGAHVEQTRRIVDGEPMCEYIIRPQPIELIEEAAASKTQSSGLSANQE